MSKIARNFYQLKNKKTASRYLGFFVLFLMMAQFSWGQTSKQITGSFPSMDGGFEGTISFVTGATSPSTGVARAGWGIATATIANNTTIVRTGGHSLNMSTSASTNYVFSPTAPSTDVGSGTSYVIQFYGWKNNTGNARTMTVSVTPDTNLPASVNTSGAIGVNGTLSTSWQKITAVVTSGSGTATPRYGSVKLAGTGGTFTNVLFDDFCMYPGTSVDTSPPSDATSVIASVASGTSLNINWSGQQYANDGGGYVIVRSTASTPVTLNVNGIYAVGNTSATGGGTVVGITSGVSGGAQSFTDIGLTTGTTYYYSVFAVDKAFNYATAATCSGTPLFPAISTTGSLGAVNTTYGTASASPTSFSVSGTNMKIGRAHV